jgi:hypothetical protein
MAVADQIRCPDTQDPASERTKSGRGKNWTDNVIFPSLLETQWSRATAAGVHGKRWSASLLSPLLSGTNALAEASYLARPTGCASSKPADSQCAMDLDVTSLPTCAEPSPFTPVDRRFFQGEITGGVNTSGAPFKT